jgi:hypothetical protein
MQFKNNINKKCKSEANYQDLVLSQKLNFDLEKSINLNLIFHTIEKLNRPNSPDVDIKIGRNDIEISKGNFYFPLQNNFRVN